MARRAHYWRRSGRTSIPQNILVFDTETLPREVSGRVVGELHTLRLGHALAYRLEGVRRTRVKELAFKRKEEFWGFLGAQLSQDRPLWVYAHNLPFDLGVVGGWHVLQGSEWKWGTVALSSSITLLRGVNGTRGVVFCDTCNYFRTSLAKLGEGIGFPKLPFPAFADPDSIWADYCRNDVLVAAAAIDLLIRFWREYELGPWKPTLASLAMSAYQYRFMRHYVLVHDNVEATNLERAAYYGGRVDTPFLGQVPDSPITELDFVSLYPSTYRERLPIQLLCLEHDPKPMRFQVNLRMHVCVADVTLATSEPEFPLREKEKVLYPVGTFRTCLADAELRFALASGAVKRVHRAAFYQACKVFQPFVDFFSPLKEKYKHQGNEGFCHLVKILENSLYGKTGQKTPRWVEFGPDALRQLEEVEGLASDSLERYGSITFQPDSFFWDEQWPEISHPIPFRCIFGQTEVAVASVESRDSVPSIAACVTSLARRRLRHAQLTAGPRNWFYSDTDSVWVNAMGLDRLTAAGQIGNGELGKLTVRQTVERLTVYGRKDYETESFRKLKGVRSKAVEVQPGTFEQLHFPGSETQLKDNLLEGVLIRKVIKTMRRKIDWCTVGPDGFTRPLERELG